MIEKEIRAVLYSRCELEGNVLYNPTRRPAKEIEGPLIIDVTIDITNRTAVYHRNTAAVHKLLDEADLIVGENERLLALFKNFHARYKIAAPFATGQPADTSSEEGLKVGLLNHSADTSMSILHNKKMLKSLEEQFLIYGKPVDGLEGEVIEDLSDFSGRCDILLLPSLPNKINSITVPLCVMRGSTMVIARNSAGYYNLNSATGVLLMESDHPDDWGKKVFEARTNPKLMDQFKQFNAKFAKSVSDESMKKMNRLTSRLADLKK